MPSIKHYFPGILGGTVTFDGIAIADVGDVLDSNGNEVLEFDTIASAVNNIGMANAATGAFPTIYATGEADTGIDFENNEGEEILKLDAIASAINELTVKNAAVGTNPVIQASGGDTDIGIEITPKGAGGVFLGGPTNFKRQVTDTGGAFATPIALTEAQSGRVILVDDTAGLDFTLPAIAAAQVGITYRFLFTVSIATNSLRFTAQSGDLLRGGVLLFDFNTANTGTYFTPDESDDLIATFNGTTTGGKKGSVIDVTAVTATGWFVSGLVFADSTLATPFS